MVSHAPTETKNPTVSTMMANPKRFSGNSHTMKILMNDITVKLNINVTTLVRIHSMLSARSNFKAKIVLISAYGCVKQRNGLRYQMVFIFEVHIYKYL